MNNKERAASSLGFYGGCLEIIHVMVLASFRSSKSCKSAGKFRECKEKTSGATQCESSEIHGRQNAGEVMHALLNK